MEILYVLVPASILIMGIAMWVFVRAVDDGQFDDLDQHALDVLNDDEELINEHVD